MQTIARWLDSIWFPTLSPTRLAILRILSGVFALWYVASRHDMMLQIAGSSAKLFAPVGPCALLTQPLPLSVAGGLLVVTLISNLAFVLGVFHRFTGPVFGLSLLLLLSYRNSWGMIYHNDNAMVLHILILGFTRAADALSFDSWRRSRQQAGSETAKIAHWRYGYPIQLISAVTASTYLLAGIAKLAGEMGWEWMSGRSLQGQVAVDAIRKTLLGEATPELAFLLYDQVWLFSFIGALSMLVELGAPLALAHRRIGYVWVLNGWAMHWGILLLMGITFRYQLTGLIFLSFFPLEDLWRAIQERLPKRAPSTGTPGNILIFDGRCRFCIGQVKFLRRLDWLQQLSCLSLHDPSAATVSGGLTHDELMEAMVLRDRQGHIFRGADTVKALSRLLPALWVVAPLLHIPGSAPLWHWMYRAIARIRYRFGRVDCEEGTCRI